MGFNSLYKKGDFDSRQMDLFESTEKDDEYKLFVDKITSKKRECDTVRIELSCSTCNHIHRVPISCDLWFCERCSRRRYGRLMHKYFDALKEFAHNFKFLTITWKDVSFSASTFKPFLKKKRYQLRKFLKKFYRGGMYSFEFSPEGHLHAHCLVIGKYTKQMTLSEQWEKISGSYILDIRKVKGMKSAFTYVLKYTSKGTKLKDPSYIEYLSFCLQNTRRLSMFGCLYNLHAPKTTKFSRPCENCGSTDSWVFVGYHITTIQSNIGNKLSDVRARLNKKIDTGDKYG